MLMSIPSSKSAPRKTSQPSSHSAHLHAGRKMCYRETLIYQCNCEMRTVTYCPPHIHRQQVKLPVWHAQNCRRWEQDTIVTAIMCEVCLAAAMEKEASYDEQGNVGRGAMRGVTWRYM